MIINLFIQSLSKYKFSTSYFFMKGQQKRNTILKKISAISSDERIGSSICTGKHPHTLTSDARKPSVQVPHASWRWSARPCTPPGRPVPPP